MFGRILRQTRQVQGMTQQELAERLFVSRQTVSSWETGRNLPSLETLARLAELLGVSTDYLLGRSVAQAYRMSMQGLPTVLVVLMIVRLVIAETAAMLWLSDAMIVAVLALITYEHFVSRAKPTLYSACLLGVVLIGLAWGQIFGMTLENQLAYVVSGALLVSEATWLYFQARFPARSGFMKNKLWWISNGVFGLLVASGVIWILFRRVDGSGHVEDIGSRLLALGVLGVLTGGIIIFELVVYFAMRWLRRAPH